MTSQPVPCAIIGTDGYAYQLIHRIALLSKRLSIVAAYSMDLKGEGAKIARAGGALLTTNLAAFFETLPASNCVVFNPTPIPLHFETTLQCLRNGCHVALEKPPVPTLDELNFLVAESQRRNLHISVGFNFLYSNVCREIRQILRSGKAGRLYRIKAIAAWRRSRGYYFDSLSRGRLEINGKPIFDGAMGNPLSHVLAFMLSLASDGDEEMSMPERVQAELYRSRDYVTADDTASVRIYTSSGVELILNCTVAAPTEIDPVIEIEAENGRIVVHNFTSADVMINGNSRQRIQEKKESRLLMLEEIASAREQNRAPLITLADCVPFTQAVTLAYQCSPEVKRIPSEFCRTDFHGGEEYHCVDSIEDSLLSAFQNAQLLSETNCSWAETTQVKASRLSTGAKVAV